jgi:hypothetical protein
VWAIFNISSTSANLSEMRLNLHYRFAALTMALGLPVSAVVDRVAVVIDRTVITESEVIDDLRLTEFINEQPPDSGPAARRAAAERLVDQELIRREMALSAYSPPAASEGDTLLRQFRQQHYPSAAAYSAALQNYGITEEQLRQRLLWQLTAIRFTDFRFHSSVADNSPNSNANASADRTSSGSVDEQLDAWLKETRSESKITFNPEAFQ